MITISAFKDREEALISKALLEAAGVPVTIRDEFGELQLQVRDTDARLAQDVLISGDPPVWRRRGSRRPDRGYPFRKRNRVGRQFAKGGAVLLVTFLLVLLVLIPLGVRFHVGPFMLFFLFMLGGCVSVVRKFFRIKTRRLPRRA